MLIQGRVVMQDRKLLTIDESDLRDRVRAPAVRIAAFERAG
jgi:hypothetical protein